MISNHITTEELSGYIYQTLDDAHREIMDQHMSGCQICRANLTHQELRKHQMSNELHAVLKAASPSQNMTFSAISSRLKKQRNRSNPWQHMMTAAPAAFAFIGLLFAVFGIWQAFDGRAIYSSPPSLGSFPTVAAFFLVLASVGQFDRSPAIQPRLYFITVLAFILWLGSIFIGLLNLIVIRDLAIMAVVALGGSSKDAAPIAIIAVMIGVLFYIGIIIGGGEYHYRNLGQPSSWKLFSIVLLGQLFLLVLPYLLW